MKPLKRFGMVVFLKPNFSNIKIIETCKTEITKISIAREEYDNNYNELNVLISGDNPDEIALQYSNLKYNLSNKNIVSNILNKLQWKN